MFVTFVSVMKKIRTTKDGRKTTFVTLDKVSFYYSKPTQKKKVASFMTITDEATGNKIRLSGKQIRSLRDSVLSA